MRCTSGEEEYQCGCMIPRVSRPGGFVRDETVIGRMKNAPRSTMTCEHARTRTSVSSGVSRLSPMTASSKIVNASGSASKTTPRARLRSSLGLGRLRERCGTSDGLFWAVSGGEVGRDLLRKSVNPVSFSFSLSFPSTFHHILRYNSTSRVTTTSQA